jgi:hypothetical protein
LITITIVKADSMGVPRSVSLTRLRELLVTLDRADELLAFLSPQDVLTERIRLIEVKTKIASLINRKFPTYENIVELVNSTVNSPDSDEDLDALFLPPAARRSTPVTPEEEPEEIEPQEEPSEAGSDPSTPGYVLPPLNNFDERFQRSQRRTAKAKRAKPAFGNYPDLLQRRVSGVYMDRDTRELICTECRASVDSHPVNQNLPPAEDGRLPLILCNQTVVVCTRNSLVQPGSQGAV